VSRVQPMWTGEAGTVADHVRATIRPLPGSKSYVFNLHLLGSNRGNAYSHHVYAAQHPDFSLLEKFGEEVISLLDCRRRLGEVLRDDVPGLRSTIRDLVTRMLPTQEINRRR
jgi:hypothetical protein